MVTRAAEHAPDESSFFARLRESGVLVRLRFSESDPGQVTGYAVTLPGHTGPDGAPAWYGGGRLAAGLTLPRLRERWRRGRSSSAEHPGAFRFTVPERDAIYAHASRQAAAAAEHIRRCAHGDPAAAADAAWAAADTLHVAARALRSPELRCAADAYARAARAPHGRLPRRSRNGDRLRRTARLIALAGDLTGGQHAHGDRARRELGRPRRCRGRAAAGPAARRAIGSRARRRQAPARCDDSGEAISVLARPVGTASARPVGKRGRCRPPRLSGAAAAWPGTPGCRFMPRRHTCASRPSATHARRSGPVTQADNGALSSLAGWLCQLEPGDRARGVACSGSIAPKGSRPASSRGHFRRGPVLEVWLKLAAGMVVLPSSMTSTRMPPGTAITVMVTVPPRRRELLCCTELVTSSLVSSTAVSEQAQPSPSVRATNSRAACR